MTAKTLTKRHTVKAWVQATRPKAFTIAIIPFVVGTLLAKAQAHPIQWGLLVLAILSALLIQVGMHFINDALDFKKGVDTSLRKGPAKGIQTGILSLQQVLAAGFLCLIFAFLLGLPLVLHTGWPILVLLLISCCLGYLYTGGPYPLSYNGLGDIFAFLFFGPVITCAAYYLHTKEIGIPAILAGIQIGCLETVLIALNNLRDIAEDAKADKQTLAVRFGKTFARVEITILALLPFLMSPLWVLQGFQVSALIPWISFPLACFIILRVWKNEPGSIFNRYFAIAALLHLSFGLLLGISF